MGLILWSSRGIRGSPSLACPAPGTPFLLECLPMATPGGVRPPPFLPSLAPSIPQEHPFLCPQSPLHNAERLGEAGRRLTRPGTSRPEVKSKPCPSNPVTRGGDFPGNGAGEFCFWASLRGSGSPRGCCSVVTGVWPGLSTQRLGTCPRGPLAFLRPAGPQHWRPVRILQPGPLGVSWHWFTWLFLPP